MLLRPPFPAPHHDANNANLSGGGSDEVPPDDLRPVHAGGVFLPLFPSSEGVNAV
jgi:magnesium chelatase family protein